MTDQRTIDAIEARSRASNMRNFSSIPDLTPERMLGYIENWKIGRLADLAMVIDGLEERDDILSSVVPKAIGDVTSREWDVLVTETADPSLKELAKQQREAILRLFAELQATDALTLDMEGGVRLLIEQILGAQSQKFAACHLEWRYLPATRFGRASYTLRSTRIPTWWTECSTGRLRFLPSVTSYDGVPMDRREWLIAVRSKCLGVAQSLAWLFKRTSLQDWFVYCSRFGLPGIEGVTDAKPGSDEYRVVEEAVEAAGSEFAWIRSKGTELNVKSWSVAGELPHPAVVERMDRMLARLWRGADLSTMSAGTGSGDGASLQGGETLLLANDRAEWVSETINRRIVHPAIEALFGAGAPRLAYFRIIPPRTPAGTLQLEIDKFLLDRGHPISQEQAAERYARPLPPQGAVLLRDVVPQAAAQPTALGSNAGTAPDSPALTSVPAALVDELHRELKVPASWLKPLTELFADLERQAKSGLSDQQFLTAAEEALKRLPDLLGEMDVQALASVFERGMGTAALDAARTTYSSQKSPPAQKSPI